MIRLRDWCAAVVAGACLLAGVCAQAQPFPNRSIRLLVPFPAGGPVDVMGRLIAQRLSTGLGQQVIVDNRPGAGSTLAGRATATAEPDGYTLLMASAATLAIGPSLYKNAGYDPDTSFAPVGGVSNVPYVMIASPKLAARTVPELIALAKANPGKLNFGVPNGAPPHMLVAQFRNQTNTDIVIVPYRGASTAITDMIGGRIDAGFETTSVMFAHLHEGSVRALAVAHPTRLAEIPGVPTMIESGVDGFVGSSWTGIVAPAGTPPQIVARLNAEINAALRSAELQATFRNLAAQAMPGTPADFAAFIAAETPRWRAMAALSGALPD
jgi:tripartite-type tricarboxylate transporter receptor subunit TctC